MKKSVYTIIEKIKKDKYIFYNSRLSYLKIYNKKEYDSYMNGDYKNFDKFIVDDNFDEYKDVYDKQMNYINKKKDYIRITIFPTMKCNARCAFCYENGEKRFDMSEETIDNTIKFIKDITKGFKKLRIYWFGGEPLVNIDAMYKISNDLIKYCDENNISYKASIATNLSLINESNFEKIINDLRIDKIEFAFDGVNEKHNKIKNYIDKDFDAFNHNMNMISKLLDKGIVLQLRLNCDTDNFNELEQLMDELMKKFGNYKNFIPYFAMIFKTKLYDKNNIINSNNLSEYKLKIIKIMNKYSNKGMELFPLSRSINNCYGSNHNSIVIAPDGTLTKCQGVIFNKKQLIGNVTKGIEKNDIYNKWTKDFLPKECKTCNIYPICLGGCSSTYLASNKMPCIKEKYYLKELLLFVADYMIQNNMNEYQYLEENKSDV